MLNINIISLLIAIPAVVIAIGFHEAAHAYMAYRLGDNTARNQGRLTINPLKHIDLIGFIMLFLFHFGWAKPVPINSENFKDKKKGTVLTALAGPAINIIIAFIATLILAFYIGAIKKYGLGIGTPFGQTMTSTAIAMIYAIISVNTGLAVFNLIPIPPLDGAKIFGGLLPRKYYYLMLEKEQLIYLVMLLLLFSGVLGTLISPIIDILMSGMTFVSNLLANLIF